MAFQQIKTGNDQLDRVQKNVAAAIDKLTPAATKTPVTTKGPSYRMGDGESILFVDQGGSAVSVVLPAKATGLVTVRSVSTARNPVTLSAVGATINRTGLVTLDADTSLSLAFDGRNWWTVGHG